MSTANKERTHGSAKELYRVANDLGESVELEFEIHKPAFKPLMPRRRIVRKCNPRKQPQRAKR